MTARIFSCPLIQSQAGAPHEQSLNILQTITEYFANRMEKREGREGGREGQGRQGKCLAFHLGQPVIIPMISTYS